MIFFVGFSWEISRGKFLARCYPALGWFRASTWNAWRNDRFTWNSRLIQYSQLMAGSSDFGGVYTRISQLSCWALMILAGIHFTILKNWSNGVDVGLNMMIDFCPRILSLLCEFSPGGAFLSFLRSTQANLLPLCFAASLPLKGTSGRFGSGDLRPPTKMQQQALTWIQKGTKKGTNESRFCWIFHEI